LTKLEPERRLIMNRLEQLTFLSTP